MTLLLIKTFLKKIGFDEPSFSFKIFSTKSRMKKIDFYVYAKHTQSVNHVHSTIIVYPHNTAIHYMWITLALAKQGQSSTQSQTLHRP
jgi:hypothetical protein